MADLRIACESLRTLQQPDVNLAFYRSQVRSQFRVITLRVIHQEARMNLEELRQQRTRRLRHVRARAALDLRQIRLADALPFAQFLAEGTHQLQLGHGAAETAERSFDLTQVADFFAQLHGRPSSISQIAIFILQFAIYVKKCIYRVLSGLREKS